MLPVVAIIGRPNVGKSTLFNRITGTSQAITADLAGTTRDRLYGRVFWNNKEFAIVDTAGIETSDVKDSVYAKLDADVQEQVLLAIEEADMLVFVVDVQSGVTSQDRAALKIIFKSGKPFTVAVNKYDSDKYKDSLIEFYKLGVKSFATISGLTGRGTGDLMDDIAKNLEGIEAEERDLPLALEGINVAIAGRPNVGKSSLFNKIVGQNRAVVSEVSGTTRDFTVASLKKEDETINFIDTAGIRRRGKVGKMAEGKKSGQIEKYSVLRSFRAIENADIVLILVDAVDGITAQDLHVAGFAKDNYKGIIVVVNKWDAIEKDEMDMARFTAYVHNKITFLPFAPVIFVSAVTGKNVDKISQIIVETAKKRQFRIPTGELNLRLGEDLLRKAPPAKRGVLPKINFITQADINPPTFVFFSNHPELIHFSYARYLENRIRDRWDFTGTPINVVFKRKNVDKKKKLTYTYYTQSLTVLNQSNEKLEVIVEGKKLEESQKILFMLHGLGTDLHERGFFDEIVSSLTNDLNELTIVRFSCSGFGESQGLQEEMTAEKITSDLKSIVEYFLQNTDESISLFFIGFSFGNLPLVNFLSSSNLPVKTVISIDPVRLYTNDEVKERWSSRPGTFFDENETLNVPRADGSTTKFGKEFWNTDFQKYFDDFISTANKTKVYLFHSSEYETIEAGKLKLINFADRIELKGDHSFTNPAERAIFIKRLVDLMREK